MSKKQSLSDYTRRQCLKLIDDLKKYSISSMFASPVDPERESCSDYFQKITNPMDLGTLRVNIINNKYESIDDFKRDVNLVWKNTYTYNGKKSLISHMAEHLEKIFRRNSEFLTGDEIEDWKNKCIKLQSAISEKFTIVSEVEAKAQLRTSLRNRKAKESNERPQTVLPPKQKKTIVAKVKEKIPYPESPETTSTDSDITEKDYDTISKFINKLNKSDDDDAIDAFFDLIKSNEPQFVKNGRIKNVPINNFQKSTLLKMKNLIKEFKSRI